ncbi:MAG: sugar phosphate isomerase/epimerase [Clostridia bacterium]|nr:sugar phosphate isomerase/epimerase [Clostridia bacterium]MBQ9996803.1 sugar phosphate isomerase/epimerase [Clostridia bacterium]
MRLAIAAAFPHTSPEEWAMLHREAGLGAVVFPLAWNAPVAQIDRYAEAARACDLKIAEVGIWNNPMDPDPAKRTENRTRCLRQLELAEYVGACCCVNISGAAGEVWDGSYAENYSPRMYEEIVTFAQYLLDQVKPVRTRYTLEPMPHMLPDSPESYAGLLRDVDRPGFGVHVDIVNMLVSPRVYYENRELVSRTFRLLGPHITSCHVKDAILDHSLTVSIRETECGQGGLDLAHYIREAEHVNPEMPMIIEHLPGLDSYRRAIDYVKGLKI